MKTLLLAASLIVVAGCQPAATPTPPTAGPTGGPTAGPSAAPTAGGGVEDLVADLNALGAGAKQAGNFATEPIGGEGFLVCIGKEPVQVYLFKDHEAALATVRKVDPDDPSKIGTSIVTWMGTPRFWLRDRIVVLYLGQDAATETALRTVLGRTFAEGQAGPPPLPGPGCA